MERSVCPQCGFFLQPDGSCKRCEALNDPELEKDIEALKGFQPTDMVAPLEETTMVTHQAKKITSIACPSCGRVDSIQKVTAIVEGETYHTTGHSRTSTFSSTSGKQNFYTQENAWKKTKIGEGKISGDTYGSSSESINAVQQSNLAQKLMPPDKPTPPTRPTFVSWPSLISSGGVGIITGLAAVVVSFIVIIIFLLNSPPGYFLVGLLANFIIAPLIGLVVGIVASVTLGKLANELDHPASTRWRMEQEYEMALKQYHEHQLPSWESAMRRWNSMFYCRRCDVVFVPGDEVYFTDPDNVISLAYHR